MSQTVDIASIVDPWTGGNLICIQTTFSFRRNSQVYHWLSYSSREDTSLGTCTFALIMLPIPKLSKSSHTLYWDLSTAEKGGFQVWWSVMNHRQCTGFLPAALARRSAGLQAAFHLLLLLLLHLSKSSNKLKNWQTTWKNDRIPRC